MRTLWRNEAEVFQCSILLCNGCDQMHSSGQLAKHAALQIVLSRVVRAAIFFLHRRPIPKDSLPPIQAFPPYCALVCWVLRLVFSALRIAFAVLLRCQCLWIFGLLTYLFTSWKRIPTHPPHTTPFQHSEFSLRVVIGAWLATVPHPLFSSHFPRLTAKSVI